ncbi:MAG: STAS domain-containing protein [Chloroflexaceae bacterium]|nr:STAS domain-containing protein [Chloroflexaceae bacterium]
MLPADTRTFDHLNDLVLWCTCRGYTVYANTAARKWNERIIGQPFEQLLVPDAAIKGGAFIKAAKSACPEHPTRPWELTLGTSDAYTAATFRGYYDPDLTYVVLIGQIEPEYVNDLHRELVGLTSELAEAQREVHRQNRALQVALHEEQKLLQTIQELTAPAVPIWDGVLLLPMVGHIDSHRALRISEQLLEAVTAHRARYVILDVSGIAMIDTAVARHLLETAHAVRLLGARAILVGMNPMIVQSVVHLGIDLQTFHVESDLQHAVAYVLNRVGRARL